jgi:hypothetical protein
MKKSHSFLALLSCSLLGMMLLSSCGDIQQELFLNADGSGKLEASFDLGEMMSMMKGFDNMGTPDDTLSDDDMPEDTATVTPPEKPKDPMQLLMDKVTDPNYPLEFDTLMSFGQIMPDSVMAKENRMDLVKKISLHMKSPANSSDLTMGIVINYDNRAQLQDIINHLDTLSGTENVMPGGVSGGIHKGTFTMYDANLKEGWIKMDSLDYSAFSSEMGMAGDSTTGSEDMGMMQMMFGSSKVRTIVHVPGEVVSCSNKDAVITKDERVIIEYDLLDVIKKGKVEGYTIKFKPKK